MGEQITLFGEEEIKPTVKRPKGGSQSSIVFHDYESFLAKFADNPKTTDDCFTPADVYEAVVKYVDSLIDLSDKEILRPFFPGGDYENAEYPEDGIVIDNPPFSMYTDICKFFSVREIPFFIFGPGMTITSCCRFCTAVVLACDIIFENGAKVHCGFATNLLGDEIIRNAPQLNKAITNCPSQDITNHFPSFEYPAELLSISDMKTMCRGGVDFSVKRSEAVITKKLDNKGSLYGEHFLLSAMKSEEKKRLKDLAKSQLTTGTKNSITIDLSDRERRIVEKLNINN